MTRGARRSKSWCRAIFSGSSRGRMRYTQFTNARRRHHRRSDGHAARLAEPMTAGSASSSMRRARTIDYAWIAAAICRRHRAAAGAEDRALLALQGPTAAEVMARHWRRQRRRLAFMTAADCRIRRHRLPGLALGLYRRGRFRDFGRRPAMRRSAGRAAARRARGASRSGSAPAIRSGSRPGFASMATTSTRRTSPVEAGLVWSIGKRRSSEGWTSSARAAHRRGTGQGRRASASASGPRAARRRAKARAITDDDGGRSAPSPRAASARPLEGADRHGLCRDATSPKPGTACQLIVRGKPLAGARRAAALRAPPLQALKENVPRRTMSDIRYTKDHEWIRRRWRHRHRRHHRSCPGAAGRRGVRRAAGDRQAAWPRAARRRWSKASRRRARSMRRCPARSIDDQQASSRAIPASSTATPRATAGSSKHQAQERARANSSDLMDKAAYDEFVAGSI